MKASETLYPLENNTPRHNLKRQKHTLKTKLMIWKKVNVYNIWGTVSEVKGFWKKLWIGYETSSKLSNHILTLSSTKWTKDR